jgi:prepilin-type N-terminal cleavage/methylation domain-containing protein
MKNSQRGFTILELLVIIAILGILAAVIIPNVSVFQRTGDLAAANKELRNVRTAAEGYQAETGSWPETTNSEVFAKYYSGTLKAMYIFDNTGDTVGIGKIISGNATAEGWPVTIAFYPDTQKWEKVRE